MVDGMMLYAELDEKLNENREAIDAMRKSGRAMARAHRQFRAARAAEKIRLRNSGIAIGLIDDAVYADETVARLGELYEYADSDHDADKEVVMLLKREIDVIREQIRVDYSESRNEQ